ncbi:MAG: FKBP-type peptidyl-prolyl cis-trans isomerase [Rickettsiales bacterium]|jgi:trigger factor|nr:FKBP-type peptidyl-prolyl cis-trans isomerase [Rickettsiales bacterium]
MKKYMSLFAVLGALFLGACDNSAKNGDTVVIDFEGFLDGQQFEGGTANGMSLKLGSGHFVAGFEEQLIGAKKGEEREVKITFPDPYVPGLAGKDVIFKVKIVDIKK